MATLSLNAHLAAPETSPALARFLQAHVVDAGVAPAATAGWIVRQPSGTFRVSMAAAGRARLDTAFDLASITKPFTALCVARLVESGRLAWSMPLAELLAEAAGSQAGAESLEALLSHRAGLQAHIELFRDSWQGAPIATRELLRRACQAVRPDGKRDALYSDLGYLLVGAGLARRFQVPLDELVRRELTSVLGLEVGSARMWRRELDFASRIAPTEIQSGRGGLVWGQVHDDNAWALAGTDQAGHAGLFGTARALLELGANLLEGFEGRGLLGSSVPFLAQQRPHGSLRLGFDGSSGSASLAGPSAGPRVFGHLGFTGTSLWCDPDRGAATVLLTNRVYPTRDNPTIRAARLATQEFLWPLASSSENLAPGLDS